MDSSRQSARAAGTSSSKAGKPKKGARGAKRSGGKRGSSMPKNTSSSRVPEPEPEPEPGFSSLGQRRSPERGGRGSGQDDKLSDVVRGHERIESSIENLGRQIFTDTKARTAAKDKLDRETEALELLRLELEEFSRVGCPVCQDRFPKAEIQNHVNGCLASMLQHISSTVERVPGVQKALRPRAAAGPFAAALAPRATVVGARPRAAAPAPELLPEERPAFTAPPLARKPVPYETPAVDPESSRRVSVDDAMSDASSFDSFDLEGSTAEMDGHYSPTTWTNPMASSSSSRQPRPSPRGNQYRSSPGGRQRTVPSREVEALSKTVVARLVNGSPSASGVRQAHDERRRLRQQTTRSPQRGQARSPTRRRQQQPVTTGSPRPAKPVARPPSPRAAWLDSADDDGYTGSEASVARSNQVATHSSGNWADRHPGLAKLVATADGGVPPTAPVSVGRGNRPAPPQLWDSLPGDSSLMDMVRAGNPHLDWTCKDAFDRLLLLTAAATRASKQHHRRTTTKSGVTSLSRTRRWRVTHDPEDDTSLVTGCHEQDR